MMKVLDVICWLLLLSVCAPVLGTLIVFAWSMFLGVIGEIM